MINEKYEYEDFEAERLRLDRSGLPEIEWMFLSHIQPKLMVVIGCYVVPNFDKKEDIVREKGAEMMRKHMAKHGEGKYSYEWENGVATLREQ